MSVNLTKPEVLREYTPEHIAYEQPAPRKLPSISPEQIAPEILTRNTGTASVQSISSAHITVIEAENPPAVVGNDQLNRCMDTLLANIDNANWGTKDRFRKGFFWKVLKKRIEYAWDNRPMLGTSAKFAIILCCLVGLELLLGQVILPALVQVVINDTTDAELISSLTSLLICGKAFSIAVAILGGFCTLFMTIVSIISGDFLE